MASGVLSAFVNGHLVLFEPGIAITEPHIIQATVFVVVLLLVYSRHAQDATQREDRSRVAGMLNKYPDRFFVWETDTVASAGPAPYYAVFDMWAPIWRLLTPDASLKVRKGNYERIFDEGRRRVRAWEAASVK